MDVGGDRGLAASPASVKSLRDKHQLVEHFLAAEPVVRQHIRSFDYFVDVELPAIVRLNGLVTSDASPSWFLRYVDVRVGEAGVREHVGVLWPLTPHICRTCERTYSAPILATVEHYCHGRCERKEEVLLGYLPIMLRSSRCRLRTARSEEELARRYRECPLDPGGYFIVRGAEKLILMQEQLCKNRILLERDGKGNVCASVTSSTAERKSRATVVLRGDRLYLQHNTLSEDVPIVVLLLAMGVESTAQMLQLISWDERQLEPSLDQLAALGIDTPTAALAYLGARIKAYGSGGGGGGGNWGSTAAEATARLPRHRRQVAQALEFLSSVLLSHVPCEPPLSMADKRLYLAVMVRGVLAASQHPEALDDKDYYGNKRVELAGQLLALLFEDLFKKFNADIKRHADAVLAKPSRTHDFDGTQGIRADVITAGLEHAIGTGNWSLRRFRMQRQGVTQVLSRLSYLSAVGMMTRITSQFEKTRKISGPRALQPSQWGLVCPCDTPEGESCGLVKSLALLAQVSVEQDAAPVQRLLYDLGTVSIASLAELEAAQRDRRTRAALVFLNGGLLGMHRAAPALVRALRRARRVGALGEYVSVWEVASPAYPAVHVATDAGRLCRPLLVLDGGTGRPRLQPVHLEELRLGLLRWPDLVRTGLIEYLDANEENDACIALHESWLTETPAAGHRQRPLRYTHLEISPEGILGVCAGLIPYANHNQSPRNTYQCAMSKQGVGALAYNQHLRTDALLYVLRYPQRPLVQTRTVTLTHCHRLPGGQNAVVAITSFSGYDIEDAIVVNRGSVERGLGRCCVLRKFVTALRVYPNGLRDEIRPPPAAVAATGPEASEAAAAAERRRQALYHAVDGDGIAAAGEPVQQGAVLVNRHVPVDAAQARSLVSPAAAPPSDALAQPAAPPSTPRAEYRPAPLVYKTPGGEPGVVDQVVITEDYNRQRLVKVMVRQTRGVIEGDKYASRFGQKGVVGWVCPEPDLPWHGESGIRPDIVFNPHGMPSRMTVGKVLELVAGKAAALDGRLRDATAFVTERGLDSTEACAEALVRAGFAYSGKDVFYSGVSGEPLAARVFCGPIYYQRLKHMAADKCFARSRGPRAILTRQPTEGRSREGGLRLGEMERDSLLGHGASMLMLERLLYSSDGFTVFVCGECGSLGARDWCHECRSGAAMQRLLLPYASKLLFQELRSMNVVVRLRLAEEEA